MNSRASRRPPSPQGPRNSAPWSRSPESRHDGLSLLESQEAVRAVIRALANAQPGAEQERLRDQLAAAIEHHFDIEDRLHPVRLRSRIGADFLLERMGGPSHKIRTMLPSLRATAVTAPGFMDLVDTLGRLVHRYFLHEEVLLPASVKGSPTAPHGLAEDGALPRLT